MADPTPRAGARTPRSGRRQLEVAAASAWESLVNTHVLHALNLVGLMGEHFDYTEAIERYLREMGVSGSMAASVRNRALVKLERVSPEELEGPARPRSEEGRGPWPLRRLGSVIRGLRDRVRGNEEVDEVLELAFARAEEGVMSTHIRHAVAFAELLREQLPAARAIQEYVSAVDLAGCRAQTVTHRAMAEIADSHLPDPDRDGIPGYIPGGRGGDA